MKNKPGIKDYIILAGILLPLVLFMLWTGFWWLSPLLILITEARLIRFIPWKKINSWLRLPPALQGIGEWIKAILVALLLTVGLRTLLIEAYKIPTPSMENTLLVGDYLFVSKIAYGPKLPNTPLSVPFLPSLLPNGRISYGRSWKLPYKRLKGLGTVNRNDVIVFNFPEGDTVVAQYPGQNYYSLIRQYGKEYLYSKFDIVYHPVDKRDNYIKRCIGLPGDTIRIVRAETYVNGKAVDPILTQQFRYYVKTFKGQLPDSVLTAAGIAEDEARYNPSTYTYSTTLDLKAAGILSENSAVYSVQKHVEPDISFRNTEVFPHSEDYRWTADNFGPIIVPAKNARIDLDSANLPYYSRIIRVYEKNTLEIKDGQIYINGVPSRSYTFRMNYYFVLGDNRHNSLDSRFWGFVPEDHLVGKAVLIWFSRDPDRKLLSGLRFNRMFKSIK